MSHLSKFVSGLHIEFDSETKQYSVVNDQTLGIYGLWETKEKAINEYSQALEEVELEESCTEKIR